MNRKKLANIVLVGVVIILLGTVGYFVFDRKSTETIILDEFSDTQNWKTYRNMIFELKYPDSWKLVEPLSFATGAVFETVDGLYIDIKALHKDTISTEAREKSSKSNYEITIDGQIGTMFIEKDDSATVFVTKGLYKYMFVSSISSERLKKVLATFKFIK